MAHHKLHNMIKAKYSIREAYIWLTSDYMVFCIVFKNLKNLRENPLFHAFSNCITLQFAFLNRKLDNNEGIRFAFNTTFLTIKLNSCNRIDNRSFKK